MTTTDNFWQWFMANGNVLKDRHHPDREALTDELLERLQRVSEGLWFEMGIRPDGTGHLIVSAEGDADFFPDVAALVEAAPAMEGWDVTAFKPARGFGFVLNRSGIAVDPGQVRFAALSDPDDPDFFGIEVGYPHYNPEREDDFLDATYTMLEVGIGELDLAEHVHHVQVGPLPEDPESAGYLALDNLHEFLPARFTH
jgi:hypothetical protein